LIGLALLLSLLVASAWYAWRRRDDIGNVQLTLLVFLSLSMLSFEMDLWSIFPMLLALCLPRPLAEGKHLESARRLPSRTERMPVQ
jgi:hypothetical protein